jgi:hypothetical protein
MTSRWLVAVAAGATLALSAPAEVAAQGRSPARAGQQTQKHEQDRRAAERERLRAREAASQRDARSANARRDARDASDVRGSRDADRERLRQERERVAQRERLRLERERQALLEQRRQQERERSYEPNRRRDVHDPWGYGSRARAGNAPAFCRSGAGHPVHGRQWCRDKGFGIGYDRWDRDGWGQIILRQPRQRQQQLGRSLLIDLLGDVAFRRFEAFGRNYGSGTVTGRWVSDWDATALQLDIGGVPFARLVDTNRDGRVDRVLLRN